MKNSMNVKPNASVGLQLSTSADIALTLLHNECRENKIYMKCGLVLLFFIQRTVVTKWRCDNKIALIENHFRSP